jgi:hypothetical protein
MDNFHQWNRPLLLLTARGILGIGTAARFPGHRSSGQPPEFVPPCGEMSNEDDDATRNGLLSKGHHSVQIFNGLGCPSRRSSALVAAYVAYKGIHDQIKEAQAENRRATECSPAP